MSSLLRERCSLTKLREELEERREKLCQCCKKFRHLAHNCRSKRKREKKEMISLNKFEMLSSRVIQCGVEERTIRRHKAIEVECFKCGERGHKCKECPLWVRKEKAVHVARPQKVQQEEKLARPIKGKAQEKERKLRRVEESKAVHMAEP